MDTIKRNLAFNKMYNVIRRGRGDVNQQHFA